MSWVYLEKMKVKVLKRNNMNVIELRKTKKDHYRLFLNGVDVTGEQERSTFRHIIQEIDNTINVGI